MSSAAHDHPYDDPRWRSRQGGPWGFWGRGCRGWRNRNDDGTSTAESWGPPWAAGHPFWAPYFMAPRALLIVLTILGFMLWWPVGLVLLGVTLWRKHMLCGYGRWSGWQNAGFGRGGGWKGGFGGGPSSSGNRAFDEYRAETLRRLEEEQKEFAEFLERLRFAKDKAEFDQFMNERRNRPAPNPPESPAEPPH